MVKARDVMRTEHLWVSSDTSTAQDVAKLMAEHNVGCLPVVDKAGRLEGIVTDRDLCCRVMAKGLGYRTNVTEFMSKDLHTCGPEADLHEIELIMRTHKIHRLPVVDKDNKLKGFISISDLAHKVTGREEEHELVGTYSEITGTD